MDRRLTLLVEMSFVASAFACQQPEPLPVPKPLAPATSTPELPPTARPIVIPTQRPIAQPTIEPTATARPISEQQRTQNFLETTKIQLFKNGAFVETTYKQDLAEQGLGFEVNGSSGAGTATRRLYFYEVAPYKDPMPSSIYFSPSILTAETYIEWLNEVNIFKQESRQPVAVVAQRRDKPWGRVNSDQQFALIALSKNGILDQVYIRPNR